MAAIRLNNVVKLVIKITITLLCLWYVSRKINWMETWQLLQQSNKWWLLIAAVAFTLSKIVSAFRLNIYLRNINIRLSDWSNIKLYWLGMFYNLFLPGGIGGDAYKVIVLNKHAKQTVKKTSAAVLLDRISGVAGLGIIAAVYYYLIYRGANYSVLIVVAVLPALVIYYWFVKKLFPSFVSSYSSTLLLGIMVQLLQVGAVYCIMGSIAIHTNINAYIFLFLLSSVVAILPFTIGGLGAREVVFLWGSQQLMLDEHQSIYISILFYLITLAVSFIGIQWVYTDPLKHKNEMDKTSD